MSHSHIDCEDTGHKWVRVSDWIDDGTEEGGVIDYWQCSVCGEEDYEEHDSRTITKPQS